MKPNYIIPTNETVATGQLPLVMTCLKIETELAHRQLERLNCFEKLFTPGYCIDEYKALLCGFYGFYTTIEPLIFNGLAETHLQTLGGKVKSGLLVQDMSLLGLDLATIQQLPLCDNLPDLSSFTRKMGALYVLEGSVLGGRIISKRLKEHFGVEIEDKLNFYGCYGENVGTVWKSFQQFMGEQFDNRPHEIQEAVSAANATFLSLQQWMDK